MTELTGGCVSPARGDGVRTLYPLVLEEGPTGIVSSDDHHTAAVIDVETTGFDVDHGRIIELAIRRIRFTDEGQITRIGKSYAWREDPAEPLDPQISKLTKLTDEMLAGQSVDEPVATKLLRSSSIVIAHNAAFDRKWVERRLPDAAGLPWACSMTEIDWLSLGYDGRTLGYLLNQAGYYHGGHRAIADVDAVIRLLQQTSPEDRTLLSLLLENNARPSWIVRANGAAFSRKDVLRNRGYRWDTKLRVWSREITDTDRQAEEWWLAANIYSSEHMPQALGPQFTAVSAISRFA